MGQDEDKRFDTIENALPVVRAHERRLAVLSKRISHIEKQLETLSSPLWKRILFRLDGWPPWNEVTNNPAWRPWRRWYRS